MMVATVSSSPQVATLRVITCLTGSVSASALGNRAHNVALGQYAGEAPARAADDHRADPARSEQARRRCRIRRRFDADNLAALGGQNCLDVHGSLLGSGPADLTPALLKSGPCSTILP
jgi:hypothetical protein